MSNNMKSILETYIKDYKIFIDTCSIIDASDNFWKNTWENIKPLIKKYKNPIILPLKCREELEKKKNESKLNEIITMRLRDIDLLMNNGFIKMRGEESDKFADNVFSTVFVKFRLEHNLILITQDQRLINDILRLNESESQQSKKIIKCFRIVKDNFIEGKKSTKTQRKIKTNNTVIHDRFKICTCVTTVKDEIIPNILIPKQDESVYTDVNGGEIKLKNKIASGGEGILYETNTQFVAKIYFKDKITKRRIEKIKLMLTKNIEHEGICYPISVLYNKDRKFVGYLMPRASGIELQKSLFIKPLLFKKFPNWKKIDTVKLCITILKKIKYLHERNIILGDINPNNIMVKSSEEVYFVDTDSYQIEDFPCPVGTVNYTAPEIQRKPFDEFLRTFGNENFAVSTLLFMIMLPGKPPYSQQGGENPLDNIIRMDFSYPLGDSSNKKTPEGPWRFIWSHLPYKIKKTFYEAFRKGEKHSTENARVSVKKWLSLFKWYLKLLEDGKLSEQDKMSEELFPTRYKKNENLNYIVCKLCKNEMSEEQCKNGICKMCLKKGEDYSCERCGNKIVFTNYAKYIKKSKKNKICRDCKNDLNKVYENRTCIDCNKEFIIKKGDYEYYKKNNLTLPKRCKNCREVKNST